MVMPVLYVKQKCKKQMMHERRKDARVFGEMRRYG
jgi:hypothetical protein